jgi:ribosomal protein S18 acetylase RimI-like enzyme
MNSFTIQNSTLQDVPNIFRLYEIATAFQKAKSQCHWSVFENQLIETEINELRQWKLTQQGQTACVWATTFEDPKIWEERNNDPAVYIHRIATDPVFRGQNLVSKIIDWSKTYAAANGKKYVRLDTVGENQGLIDYYTKCGFDFLGLRQLKDTEGLPAHYQNATVSLFQIEL